MARPNGRRHVVQFRIAGRDPRIQCLEGVAARRSAMSGNRSRRSADSDRARAAKRAVAPAGSVRSSRASCSACRKTRLPSPRPACAARDRRKSHARLCQSPCYSRCPGRVTPARPAQATRRAAPRAAAMAHHGRGIGPDRWGWPAWAPGWAVPGAAASASPDRRPRNAPAADTSRRSPARPCSAVTASRQRPSVAAVKNAWVGPPGSTQPGPWL